MLIGIAAMLIVIIAVLALVGLLGGALAAHHGLARRRDRVRQAWSEIDEELNRRHDLIPNLVQTVKGYASEDSATFQAVTAARGAAVRAGVTGDPARVGAAESFLSERLKSLFVVSEKYPRLRGAESFLQIQEQLTATEVKLEYARRSYNTWGQDYNLALQGFPRNLVASSLRFHSVAFFQTDDAQRQVPGSTGPQDRSTSNGPMSASPPVLGRARSSHGLS
jgi:LemA protein